MEQPSLGAPAGRTERRTLRGLPRVMGDEEAPPLLPAIASARTGAATCRSRPTAAPMGRSRPTGAPTGRSRPTAAPTGRSPLSAATAAALTVVMAAALAPFGDTGALAAAPAPSGVGKVASLQNQVETKR